MRSEPDVLDFEYMRHEAAVIDAWARPEKMLALHIGAGVCTLPRYLVNAYPASRHIAVDVDADLPALARQWWDLPRAPMLKIRHQDGWAAVADRHDNSVDLIVRDAFADGVTPESLASPEWWGHAVRVLRPGGLVVANIGTKPGSSAHKADARSAWDVCGDLVALGEPAVLKERRRGNVILATRAGLDVHALQRYAASAPLPTGVSLTWGR